MDIVVIYNPKSGSAMSKHKLNALLQKNDITALSFIDITKKPESELKKYASRTNLVVVGYGGDGTLRSVASLLKSTKFIFAPLPGGTLNHFTKDLGIDQDIEIAVQALINSKQTTIDTASVNGQIFLNNSSIGLYPSSLAERSKLQEQLGKWPAAVAASVTAFFRFKLYTVTINEKTFKTPFIFVGNNRYDIDNFMERTSLQDGTLSIFIVKSSKRRTLIKVIWHALIGKTEGAHELIEMHSRKMTIEAKKPRLRVSFDGEHEILATPLRYEVHAKSLRVLK